MKQGKAREAARRRLHRILTKEREEWEKRTDMTPIGDAVDNPEKLKG